MFADKPARMGTNRVEVAEDADGPTRITCDLVAKHLLDHELGSAVGTYGVERVMLGIGQELRHSVNRRGGTENNLPDTCVLHRPKEALCADNVVVVVVEGSGNGVLDRLQACEMHRRGQPK